MFIVMPFCGAKSHQDFKFTHKQKRAYEMYTSYALLFSTEYVKIVSTNYFVPKFLTISTIFSIMSGDIFP